MSAASKGLKKKKIRKKERYAGINEKRTSVARFVFKADLWSTMDEKMEEG